VPYAVIFPGQGAAAPQAGEPWRDHEAWSIRAHSSFLLGNLPDCEFEFAEAIRIAPDVPDYHQDLGEAFALQEKWPNAMREFERALTLSPNNPVAQTSIAQVLMNTDQSPQALQIMEKVNRENPNNDVFKYYLAAALDGAARESLTLLRDRTIIVTSAAQADRLEQYASRMESLRLSDPEVRDSVVELRRLATAGRSMMWIHSQAWRIYGFALFALLVGFCGGLGSGGGGVALGLLVFAPAIFGLVYIYIKRHRKPSYEHAAVVLRGQIVRTGI